MNIDNPGDIVPELTSILTAAEPVATQIASQGGEVATSVIGQASALVSSAVAAGESLVHTAIPENFSLGTKAACVGYSDSMDCYTLPINESGSLATLLVDQSGSEPILQVLKLLPSVQTLMIVGNVFIFLSLLGLWKRVPFARIILLSSSAVSFLFFSIAAAFIWSAIESFSKIASTLSASFDRGPMFDTSIIVFVCSLLSLASCILLWVWD